MFKPGEVILVICVFSFVVCCFSIPIIIYATSSNVTPSQDIGIEIDVDNCPQQVIIAYVSSYYGAKYCDYPPSPCSKVLQSEHIASYT